MAISRISSATNNDTTITLGTHAKDDLILVFAYRDNSNTPATLPSGWYGLIATGASSLAITVGWKFAASSSDASDTWTNATTLHAIVYRGGANNLIVPKIYSSDAATGTSVRFAGQPNATYETNSGDLWIVGALGMRNSSNLLETRTWTGLSNVTSSTDGSLWQAIVNDSNATRTTQWNLQTATVTNSAAWRSAVFGLQEVPYPAASGGGFRPVNIRGGADQ